MRKSYLNIAAAVFMLGWANAQPSLTHRYSFTTDVSDSVGTANGIIHGNVTLSGGAANFPGATHDDYIELPSGLITNYTTVTFELWVDVLQNGPWEEIYAFGNQDGGGAGANMLMFTPHSGSNPPDFRMSYAQADPGYTDEHVINGSGTLDNLGSMQVVCVYDPPNNSMTLYTNGTLVATLSPVTTGAKGFSLTNIYDVHCWLGRSLYNPDAPYNGSIDEFRIYNAPLGPLQIFVDSLTGPDSIDTNIGVNSLSWQLSTNMVVGSRQDTTVTFNTAHYGIVTVSGATEASYSSADRTIISINNHGQLFAMGQGSTTVSAAYNGKTNSVLVTVAGPALIHRYSFTSDASDSVGGANGTLVGSATISKGAVNLPGGTTSNDPNVSYVDLPNNLLTNLTAITVETWVTDNGSGTWARIWDLGNSVGGEDVSDTGSRYVFLTLPDNNGELLGNIHINDRGGDNTVLWASGGRPPVGQEAHIVWATDVAHLTGQLYVNGAQVGINTNMFVTPADIGPSVNDWLGRSQYGGDASFNGSIDEFRIYNGPLSPFRVAIDAAAGPDKLITDPGALQSIALTVSANMNAGTIQRAAVSGNFANVTNVNLSGLAAYTSSKTNILTVDASGVIRAVGVGSASVTATYGGNSQSATINVTLKPVVLAHRYSFTSDASDSVGTANGTLVGGATIGNGALSLPGSGGVQLPSGVIGADFDAVTIETWIHANMIPDGQVAHLFGFGNTNSAGAPQNFVRLRVHSGGNNSSPGISTGTEQTTFVPGPVAGDAHVVVIYNPLAGYLEWFLNGNIANSNAITALLNPIRGTNDIVNYIGEHVDATGPMTGTVDEFRIYNGALSLAQLRTSLAAGPGNAVFDSGTIKSVSVKFYSNFISGTIQRPLVQANSATVTNINLTGVAEVSYSSGNTNVLTVLPDGTVHAVGVGTATLTATYQGVAGSVSVTTLAAPTAMLVHRYSFTSDASDSVGGADGALRGDATISGKALMLANDATGGRGSYLELPSDLIDGFQAVSIEAWVNLDSNLIWSRIADFGNYTSGGGGQTYLFLCPHTGGSTVRMALNDGAGEQLVDTGAPALDGQGPTHIAAVVDPVNLKIGAVYTNGVLMGSVQFTKLLTAINDVHNFVGRSMYTGDAFLNGSIDEFRIYYGALSASQIATNFAAGPDFVVPIPQPTQAPSLAVKLSGANVVLSWPDTATGFVLEATTALGPQASWAAVSGTPQDVGGNFTVTIQPTGSATKFYRLRK